MSDPTPGVASSPYRFSPAFLLLMLACSLCLLAGFREGVVRMAQTWFNSEEYGHGVLIPLIAAFLTWQRKEELRRMDFAGHWSGVPVTLTGLLLGAVGQAATVFSLQQYALIIVLWGLVLALGGRPLARVLAAPLLVLLFMVPLPNFFTNGLSLQLQLISSQLGVWFIRLFGISVFLEGNVIDLGSYRLQVADACSGLRYLFPLLTMGFIFACLFKGSLWKRVVIVLSAVPLTIVMNSFRIGTIGFMVDRWGAAMAEGSIHEFQGWLLFMVCAGLLLLEVRLLARLGGDRRPWRDVFGFTLPARSAVSPSTKTRSIPRPFLAACVGVGAFGIAAALMPARSEVIPARDSFSSFPARLSGWVGHREAMEQVYLDTLMLDDYILATYTRDGMPPVNFYAAWYNSQRAGQSAHSPRSCLPGGGWKITDIREANIPAATASGQPLRVNRVLIENGEQRELVYYWFEQRGRDITDEYLVKWYLFIDSLLRQRTDGALVRLVVPIAPGTSVEDAEQPLGKFALAIAPELRRYVPN